MELPESQDDSLRVQVNQLLFECLERDEKDWTNAVEEICCKHPVLADEIRERFQVLKRVGFVAQPSESFPERLGGYRLMRKLGKGGMGIVYLARQNDLNRDVALKLIRPELLFFPKSKERFRREISAIARLQHPGIVPIYNFGEEEGVPFFAMERIQGRTLAEVLEALKFHKIKERTGKDFFFALAGDVRGDGRPKEIPPVFQVDWSELCVQLIRQVVEALDHAHSRGVIHRDVKPSNILVTPTGRALLFDFGLAAATGDPELTRSGSQLGSLAYMSPEQISGEHKNWDARSDIYSLGATLYELLTLRPPYLGKTTGEIRERILRGRPLPIRGLNPSISWDLETVCLKAMELDPASRYATAVDFARDLGNVLKKLPIEARPPGVFIRSRRFVQRNPTSSTALALVVSGALFFGVQQKMAKEEAVRLKLEAQEQEKIAVLAKQQAESERETASEISEFLQDLLGAADPERKGKDVLVREVLDIAAQKLEKEFVQRPSVKASLHQVIGQTYRGLGLYEEAKTHLQAALTLQSVGEKRSDVARALNRLGILYYDTGDYKNAEFCLRSAIESRHEKAGEDDPEIAYGMATLAVVLTRVGQFQEAETLHQKSLAMYQRALGEQSEAVATCMVNLAILLKSRGEIEEAECYYREALRILKVVDGSEHIRTVSATLNLASLLLNKKNDPAQAEPLLREAFHVQRRILGDEHPAILFTIDLLANLLVRKGQSQEAETLMRQSLEGRRNQLGESHADTAISYSNLGQLLLREQRYEEAEELFRNAIQTWHKAVGDNHPGLGRMTISLASVFLARADYQEAAKLFRDGLVVLQKSHPEDNDEVVTARSKLSECLMHLKEFEESEQLLLKNYDLLKARQNSNPKEISATIKQLVELYEAWSRPKKTKEYEELLSAVSDY